MRHPNIEHVPMRAMPKRMLIPHLQLLIKCGIFRLEVGFKVKLTEVRGGIPQSHYLLPPEP